MAFVNSSPGLARQRNPGITVRVYGIATLKGFAINHPWNTEPIDAHAEPSSPESFLERHLHTALFGQSIEDALTFGDIFQMERHIHAFWLLVTARRSISTH